MFMQAIEAYHRMRYRNYETEPAEHARRINVILSSIPEQYREWMRDGLRYSNEPSHGQRLKELYQDFQGIMDEHVEDRGTFIHRVILTRNQLTHLEDSEESQILKGKELILATFRLRYLLELCLLRDIGVSDDQIKRAAMANDILAR